MASVGENITRFLTFFAGINGIFWTTAAHATGISGSILCSAAILYLGFPATLVASIVALVCGIKNRKKSLVFINITISLIVFSYPFFLRVFWSPLNTPNPSICAILALILFGQWIYLILAIDKSDSAK